MAVADEKYQQVLDVSSASAQACAAAQMACQRAVEEITGYVKELRAWEKRPRQVLKEIVREVQGEAVVPNLPAVIEQVPVDLTPVTDAIDAHANRVAAIEAAIQELQRRQQRLVPVPTNSVSEERVAKLEAEIASLRAMTAAQTVMSSSETDVFDRLAAVEELVVEGMQAPKALSDHLKLMADIMDAMQRRIDGMREVDEQQRQIAVQSAQAQGGLAAAVQSMRADMDTLTAAVAQIRNQMALRDNFRTAIISRGR
jgi:hypothetical protein